MKKNYLVFGGSALLILIVVLLLTLDGRSLFSGASRTSLITGSDLSLSVDSSPESKILELSPSPAESAAPAPIRDFVFTANNFSYSLPEIKVNKGDLVRVVLQNVDGTHDLRIDEFNVATRVLKAGEEQMVEFVADKTGVFEYYCSVGIHRQMGMKGYLNVVVE